MTLSFDYSQCEKEDLAHAGACQGHGVLACVNDKQILTHITENATQIGLGCPRLDCLGLATDDVLNANELRCLRALGSVNQRYRSLKGARVIDGRSFELVIHPSDTGHILEWEPESHFYDTKYGKAYTTALMTLTLGASNQLLPIFQR